MVGVMGWENLPNPKDERDQQFDQLADQNKRLMGLLEDYGKKTQGRPDAVEFDSQIDPTTGLLYEHHQVGGELNMDALNRMRQEAMRGPGEDSVWRQLQQTKLERMAGGAAADQQRQAAHAMSNMAMRGGLRGGSAERLTGNAATLAAQARQGVLGRGTDLDIQDETQRQALLQNVNQANLQQAQFQRSGDQFNIQNSLNEVLQQRAADINQYNEQMRAWAAERTAAATPSGGGGGKK